MLRPERHAAGLEELIDPRSLEPGYEREPLPEEPDWVSRVPRLVREAFNRKRRVA
uniref:hypothetical protein n=1 Tax=Parafannyhessea umbonata TaxID=604330 RepID=UPI00359C1F87